MAHRSSYASVLSGGTSGSPPRPLSQHKHALHDPRRPPSGHQDADGMDTSFWMPSYLRRSRYADRLEAAHRARVQQQQQSRRPSEGDSLSTSSSGVNLHKMVPSHRGMTHDIVERAPPPVVPAEDAAVAPLPSRWSERDKSAGLEVLADGREVRFGGLSRSSHDEAAAIRADHPMPRRCGIYYFEVAVVSKGREGLIGIGISGPKVPLNRLPGWEPDSWAYHGDDGYSFCCTSSGKGYGPKFTSNDVIGCGVNFRNSTVFFTKNGVHLGTAFTDVKCDKLYPSVGMKKPNEHLRVNFGHMPFVFDIDQLVQREKAAIEAEIMSASVASVQPPLDEAALTYELVAQFLAHDGYVETARAFASEVRAASAFLADGNGGAPTVPEPEEDVDAIQRQKIRAAILGGDIDRALKLTTAYYPTVLRENENIYFKLRCRKFIEMIRRCTDLKSGASIAATSGKSARAAGTNGHASSMVFGDGDDSDSDSQMDLDDHQLAASTDRMDTSDDHTDSHRPGGGGQYAALLAETIEYGQELRAEFRGDPRREVKKALEDTFALIAYQDARQSSLAPLLARAGRVPVAEELNGAILVSLGKPSSAALERLCQQTEVLVSDLGEDGGEGAFVHVRRHYLH